MAGPSARDVRQTPRIGYYILTVHASFARPKVPEHFLLALCLQGPSRSPRLLQGCTFY